MASTFAGWIIQWMYVWSYNLFVAMTMRPSREYAVIFYVGIRDLDL